ncbi:mitochondrial Tryptophanyl-tRNA synthetase [Lipomyces oligophaga]|uniref:mitochondrial Tryptophanyl-tRNA synthetase n=1 Tax=Lipomyces oligophaga TaxID=45792 RepID=UPI0034CF3D02
MNSIFSHGCRSLLRASACSSALSLVHNSVRQLSTPAPMTVYSGIQPTGIATIGNYLGALQGWARLCARSDPQATIIFSVADLHALTASPSPEQLRLFRRRAAALIVASGVDPERSILYYQSAVPSHSELCWILSCSAEFGYLSRMTQWKSKLNIPDDSSTDAREAQQNLKLGLFAYPVLQAADILLFQTTHVPVGHDQVQHLELTRHIASRFNTRFDTPVFTVPEVLLTPTPRIMSLKNPLKKMSKSDPSPASRILISDTPDQISKKIKGAATDSIEGITYNAAERPGVANLLDIASGILEKSQEDLAAQFHSMRHGEFKSAITDIIVAELDPVRKRFDQLVADTEYLDSILERGARQAAELSAPTLSNVKRVIGISM